MKNLNLPKLQEMYLDRVNNFLTDEKFADHYGITKEQARLIIKTGQVIQEAYADLHKKLKNKPENC